MARFVADVKKYDPDDEDEAVFDTLEEATEWLRQQQAYGFHAMWLNNERVQFVDGKLDVVDFRLPNVSEPLFQPLKPPTREEVERFLRPVPTNSATPGFAGKDRRGA